MLADDIIAAVSHPPTSRMYRLGTIATLAGEIAQARRFVLSRDVIGSMAAIGPKTADEQESLTPFCKLPFRLTWMEFEEWQPCQPGQRAGMLITADETMQRGHIDLCVGYGTSAKDRALVVAEVRRTFDWRATPEAVPHDGRFGGFRPTLEHIRIIREQNMGNLMENPYHRNSSPEVYVRSFERGGVLPSPYSDVPLDDPGFDVEGWVGSGGERNVARVLAEAARAEAFLLMLNCKNLVATREQEVAPQLARARQRSGKLPLRPYVAVTLDVSRAIAARAGNGEAHTSPRLHIVRGHFKIRKTGIFWWSPFARGTGDKPIRNPQIYRVKTALPSPGTIAPQAP